jgi:uncharacterized protein
MVLKFLAGLVLAYFVVKGLLLLTRIVRSSGRPTSEASAPEGAVTQEMVKDPVCGLYLPGRDALRVIVQGVPVYFCSEQCRRKYIEGVR